MWRNDYKITGKSGIFVTPFISAKFKDPFEAQEAVGHTLKFQNKWVI